MSDIVARPNVELVDTFHNAMRPLIFICQFLGILPLRNALNRNVDALHFKWLCPQTINAVFVTSFLILCVILWIKYWILYKGYMYMIGELYPN